MDLFDYQMMLQAIKLGEKGRVNAPPNPWVGCVITRNQEQIAEGYHTHAGAPHAEPAALAKCASAEGATVYVTLEPCAHHGRTPPCTEALIRAGVDRVVIGTLDPDPRVAGRGVRELKDAGIEVEVGVAEKEVKRSLAPYLHQRGYQKVYTLVKAACSLDGHMCAGDYSSQWITGEEARVDAHRLRSESQAIVTGAGTVIRDNPKLNVRSPIAPPLHPPLRVVLDSKGRTSPDAHVFHPEWGPSLLITTSLCPKEKLNLYRDQGVDIAIVDESNGAVSLSATLNLLYSKGVIQAMIEGGPTLTGEFIKQRLYDQLTLYFGPKLIGGEGISFTRNIPWKNLTEAQTLKLLSQKSLGDTIRLDYEALEK